MNEGVNISARNGGINISNSAIGPGAAVSHAGPASAAPSFQAGSAPAGPPDIFINYRRRDHAGFTGRLHDCLRTEFGPGRVFMDVSSIQLGKDYEQALRDALTGCKVMLTVIGPAWRTSRLADPADHVRHEIEIALSHGVPLIPVLMDDARMPDRTELPPSIIGLATKQGQRVSHDRFESDVIAIVQAVRRAITVG